MDRLNLKGRPHLHLAAGAQIQKEKQTNKTSKFKRVFWLGWSMWSWLKQNGTHNNPDRGTRKLPWQIFRCKSSDNDRCANEGVWSWYKEGIKAGIESQLWQARVPVSKWSIHCWNVGVLICPIAVKVFCCTANHVLKSTWKCIILFHLKHSMNLPCHQPKGDSIVFMQFCNDGQFSWQRKISHGQQWWLFLG